MVGNLSARPKQEFLVDVDLFKHLSESCLDSLVNDRSYIGLLGRASIFQTGQLANSLFVLERGCVRIFRAFGNKTQTLRTVRRLVLCYINK